MKDFIGEILPIIAVVVGFLLSQGFEHWKKRDLIKRYSLVLRQELKRLKDDIPDGINQVIKTFDDMELKQQQWEKKQQYKQKMPIEVDTSKFIKRWSFRNKYAFLRNNFENIAVFKGDTITSLLKIYSFLEEFEEYKQQSISNTDALDKIGMVTDRLLITNLRNAQKEIPLAILYLEKE